MNRRFRMISLTCEALSLELEDVQERDEKYEREFKEAFREEIRYLMIKEAEALKERQQHAAAPEINLPGEEEIISTTKTEQTPMMKELYRALAKATHPDLHGTESEDEFKEIQSAYAGKDLIKLIAAANKNGIAPEFSEEDLIELENMLKRQRSEIEEIKKTVRWQWGVSERTHEVRQMVMASIGAHPARFYAWKEEERAVKRQEEQKRREAEAELRREAEEKERAERARRKKQARRTGPNLSRQKDRERMKKKEQQRSR